MAAGRAFFTIFRRTSSAILSLLIFSKAGLIFGVCRRCSDTRISLRPKFIHMWSAPVSGRRWTVITREPDPMSDYMFMLDSHLDAGQNRTVAEIQRLATDAGMNVWLTGGAMRDMLRGAPLRDLDFTVEHDAPKMARQLVHRIGGEVLVEDPQRRWAELRVS